MNYKEQLKKIVKSVKNLTKKESYGLQQLDLKIKPFLSEIKNGFFIEAGANNGLKQSNTYYFEKNYGWTGILIEPIPELYEQCKKNRPNSIVVNAALVSNEYTKKTVPMHYSGLMSLVEGSMKTREDEQKHIETGCQLKNLNTYRIDVPAKTLSDILTEKNIQRIDFLSLDVEGYELESLKGLDLEKYKPKYILIEARYREEILDYLTKYSYKPVADFNNYDILFKLQ